MADDLKIKPSTDAAAVPFAADQLDTLNGVTQSTPKPLAQRIKIVHGADGVATDASAAAPFPVTVPAGVELGATSLAALETIGLDGATLAALETIQVGNQPSDPATQTTLAALLAAAATAAKQDIAKTAIDAVATAVATADTNRNADDDALRSLVAGTLVIKKAPLTSSASARVASSATAVTLQALNANRRALKIFNESTAVLYVKDGAAATITDYSVQVAPGGYYEWPLPIYTGIVTGLWASANGAAQVTEGV